MSTQREIALEQALVSAIAAAGESGFDLTSLVNKATVQLLGDSHYRQVDHPYITMACDEIKLAHQRVLELSPSKS